jgi:hypothetical protein
VEERSSRRIRDLMTLIVHREITVNEIECTRYIHGWPGAAEKRSTFEA